MSQYANKETARLLNVLADFLRTVPRKRFNYRRWVGENWKGKQDLSCGTTACAMGWAATMPIFRRRGLRLELHDKKVPELGGYVVLRSKDGLDAAGFHAAADLFGISVYDANYLFSPDEGEERATPKQVARKIRDYIKHGAPDERV